MSVKGMLPKGSVLLCHTCFQEVYETTKDLFGFEIISAEFLKPANPAIPMPIDGLTKVSCPLCNGVIFKCGMLLLKGFVVHEFQFDH